MHSSAHAASHTQQQCLVTTGVSVYVLKLNCGGAYSTRALRAIARHRLYCHRYCLNTNCIQQLTCLLRKANSSHVD
eukprot:18726-Heterococcus_DN1.PRE.2